MPPGSFKSQSGDFDPSEKSHVSADLIAIHNAIEEKRKAVRELHERLIEIANQELGAR